MKRYIIILVISICAVFLWWGMGNIEPIYKRSIEPKEAASFYDNEVLWPRTESDKQLAGEASGVAVNSKGDIYYLHRGSSSFGDKSLVEEPAVIVLDGKTKEVKERWGRNIFQSPHGIEIDSKDNVWITDILQNKVFQFNSSGEMIRTFGSDYPFYMESALRIRNVLPGFPTGMDAYTFARPTDVTVMDDGSFVVSDGYRNNRIVKFDKNGKLEWERNERGTKSGEFHLPHGITHDENGRIYVADRSNARVQVFAKDGNYIETWTQDELGRPFGIDAGSDGKIYIADGGNELYENGGKGSNQVVIMNQQGLILERFGEWGSGQGAMKIPHDITVLPNGDILVADLKNSRLVTFTPQQ
ncbi:peptidylamidoglycolate lyase [Bacillus sp. SB49]|uniref:peptidyl-alpha-hydroxyglycine alpha-amidating lyase family protein n=1 Tax=Bacillus sp. SB49 TaxID=1071080 RepID=UPI000410084C|nr:peptidyl-alpha-hydroxyglycine alpha-amidating lyase family protein [Bacillus sp. SB49]QHT47835.1 peptidylamidoglycolate lyase [Bacillus sp. SB49]